MKSLSHAKYAKDAKASINRAKNPEESFLCDLGVLERATLFLTRRPRERAKDLCLCSVCSLSATFRM